MKNEQMKGEMFPICLTPTLQANILSAVEWAFLNPNTRFMSDNKELDICESYNYLGILFNFNNKILNAKKKHVEQVQKAL
jgi:hypothetical protein